jgi:hypothetical protein
MLISLVYHGGFRGPARAFLGPKKRERRFVERA